MTGPLPDKWYSRDFPVLIELTKRFDQDARIIDAAELPEARGMTDDEVQAALHALIRRGLIDATVARALGGPVPVVSVKDVAGAAYLMTGLHPDADDQLSRLVQALQQAAAQVGDEEERGRLRRAADALLSISREVAVGVITAAAVGQVT